MKHTIHRKINLFLTCLTVALGLFILFQPFLPAVIWKIKSPTPLAPYGGVLAEVINTDTPDNFPKENRIVIPSASIDLEIRGGNDISVIDGGGAWLKPLNVSTPEELGNAVVVAHRFTYLNPAGGFYHLDKVKQGDALALYWDNKELLYRVADVRIVDEEALEIENDSQDRRLTLYTCTPILSTNQRIVVVVMPLNNTEGTTNE